MPAIPLVGKASGDVAIVGAGLAGLSTALYLALAGRDVTVIDAVTASTDGACASAGIVAPQIVRHTPAGVCAKLGRDRGGALLGMIAEAGRHAFQLARDHDIACAAQPDGFLAPTSTRTGAARLRELVAQWSDYRRDLTILDATETARLSGARGYAGALLDASGGGLDPAALLLGLERAAVAAGARVHRGGAVTGVTQGGRRWIVRTEDGSLDARTVLLCANGGNLSLHPRLRGSALPLPVFEAATAPLDTDMRCAILPEGHSLTDISTDIFSIRFDRNGRLITAYPYAAKASRAAIERAINRRLSAMLPAYRAQPIDHLWHGTAWINGNFLPRAVPLGEGLTAIQACNGRGIAINLIAGREMARWITEPGYAPRLPFETPRAVPGFALLRHLPRLVMAGGMALRRLGDTLSRRSSGPGR